MKGEVVESVEAVEPGEPKVAELVLVPPPPVEEDDTGLIEMPEDPDTPPDPALVPKKTSKYDSPKWLLELLDNRDLLIEQLSSIPLTPDAEKLATVLIDLQPTETYKGAKIGRVLKNLGWNMTKFFSVVRESREALSQFRTRELIDHYRPLVVHAVMKSAMLRDQACATCSGNGKVVMFMPSKFDVKLKVEELVNCLVCDGKGRVTVLPDHDRQVTALKLANMMPKDGSGTTVNVNTAVDNSSGGWKSSPDFRKETDKMMYPAVQKLIEAEERGEVVDVVGERLSAVAEAEVLAAVKVPRVGRPLGKRTGKVI